MLAHNVEVAWSSMFRLVMPDENAYEDVFVVDEGLERKFLDSVASCGHGRRAPCISISTTPMSSPNDHLPFKFSTSSQFASFSPSSTSACSSRPPTVVTSMGADSRAGLHLGAFIVPKLQALHELPFDLTSALVAYVVHGAHV